MAELFHIFENGDNRRYFNLVTRTHRHRLYLDEIDSSGNGTTSHWVDYPERVHVQGQAPTYRARSVAHEHHIENWKIVPARGGNVSIARETHTHEDVDHEELELAKEEQLHELATRTDRENLEDSGVIDPETDAGELLTGPAGGGAVQGAADDALEFDEDGNLILNIALFGPPFIGRDGHLDVAISGFTRHGPDPNSIISATLISAPTSENVEAALRPPNSVNTDVVPIDWTRRTEDEPFFAENSSEYSITVLACEGFVPGVENAEVSCEAALQQAAAQGILNLAEYYNRKLPPSRDAQLALLQSAETEYHLDERPKARAKILVKIPARIFDLLPEISEDPSIDPDTGMPRSTSITLDSLTIKEQIDKVMVGLIEYDEQVRIQGLNIVGLNIRNEAKRLGSFFAKLKDLLTKNRFSLNQEVQVTSNIPTKEKEGNKIEIGFSGRYEIKHVLFNSKPVSIGFSAFRKTYPMSNPTTIAYISRLNEMVADISLNNPPSLTEFILKYTFPRPQINAGAPGQNFNLPGSAINIRGLPELPGIPSIPKLPKAPKIPKISDIGDVVSLASSTTSAAIAVRQTINDVYMSVSKRSREDQKIKDPDFVNEAAQQSSIDAHFVGDNVLGDLPNLVERVGGDIEAVFSEILNKIDITTIAQFAAAAALGEFPNLGNLMKGTIAMFFDKINNSNKKYFNSALGDPDLVDFTWDMSILEMSTEEALIFNNIIPEKSRPIVMGIFNKIEIYDDTPGRMIVEYFRDNIISFVISSREKVDGLVQEICVAAELNMRISTTTLLEELGTLMATCVAYLKILQILVPRISQKTPESDYAIALAATIATLKIAEQLCDPKKFDMFDIPSLPSIPSIELPRLPTFDIMGWVIPRLEISFPDFIFNIVISMVLETISAALDINLDFDPSSICSCVDPVLNLNVEGSMSFGEMDVGSMIMDGLTTVGTAIGTATGLIEEEDPTPDMFGWILSQCLEFPPSTDHAVLGQQLKSLLEDVSSQLTPDESLSLLRGTAAMWTVRIVATTLNSNEYNDLRGSFGNPINLAKIIDVLEHIGKFLDSGAAESAREQAISNSSDMSVSERRQQLLDDKYGDSLSTEQIKSESDKNSEKNNLQALKLLQAAPDSSAFDIPLPSVVGGSSAMIPKNPPSVQHMMDRTIETMFESIIMTFEQALHGPLGFIQTMCFKSGIRSIYESLQQQDEMNQAWQSCEDVPAVSCPSDDSGKKVLVFAQGFPVLPPSSPGAPIKLVYMPWIDKAPPHGHAIRLTEINDSLIGVIKTYLERVEFEREGEEEELGFKFKSPRGNDAIIWEIAKTSFKIPRGSTSVIGLYDHVLKIPTPPRPPFLSNHNFQIKVKQKIDFEINSSNTSQSSGILRPKSDKHFQVGADSAGKILNQVLDSHDLRSLFAAIATRDMKTAFPNFDRSPIENYLKGTAYYNTMTDIIKMFIDELLKSERMFDAKVDNLENPEESIMNWRLEPKSDTSGETQTTLLGLEDLLEKTKERYNKTAQEETESASDDIQEVLLSSVVEATIRLHVVELFLKTLPVFDIFRKDDIISNEFVEYAILRVQEACVRQDPYWPGYYENILEHVEKVYEGEWKLNNNKLKDPITETPLLSPKKIGAKGALNYFIKNAILNMSNVLEELPMMRAGQRSSIEKMFLNSMLSFENHSDGVFPIPTVDNERIAAGSGATSRTRPPEEDVLGPLFDSLGIDELYEDRFIEVVGSKNENTLVLGEQNIAAIKLQSGLGTFQDGGLLLEKYIQYTVSEEIVVSAGESGFSDTVAGPKKTKIRSLSEGIDAEDLDNPYISDLKIGLRLIYVPEFDSQNENLLEHSNTFKEPHRLRRAGKDYRSFHILERFVGQKQYGSLGAVSWQNQAMYREIYPLPLISVTNQINHLPQSDDHQDHQDDETYIKGNVAQADINAVEFRNYKNDLINKMIEQDRFKLLFEHCFPLRKILSIITIYIEVMFSTAGDARLLSVFDQTRSTLKSIFDGVLNMNNFSYRDRNTEAAGGNAGLLSGRVKRGFSEGRLKMVYNNESHSFEKR